ncbi:MAG: hypothetical protein GWM87_06735 [Xanthomonadales bacterium]|nr:hypothetical protein [Xanthomonadales bacterium]NIX12661.1 hypothetical protein [Xanthomonadales bacterium]
MTIGDFSKTRLLGRIFFPFLLVLCVGCSTVDHLIKTMDQTNTQLENTQQQLKDTQAVITTNTNEINKNSDFIGKNISKIQASSLAISKNRKLIDQSSEAVKQNTEAAGIARKTLSELEVEMLSNIDSIKKSTGAIQENFALMEQAGEIMRANRRAIEDSTTAIRNNSEAIAQVTGEMSDLMSLMSAFPFNSLKNLTPLRFWLTGISLFLAFLLGIFFSVWAGIAVGTKK